MHALDLTPAFDELLRERGGQAATRPRFDPAQTEGFLKEAYRINEHIATLARQLADVRPAYLSTAPPRRAHHHHHHNDRQRRRPRGHDATATTTTSLTDGEREEIDANAKRLLRDLNASIRGLAEAEALHQETQQARIRQRHAGPSLRLPGRRGGKGLDLGLGGLLAAAGAAAKSPEQAADEEAQKQAAAHHESVLWFLRQRLQACGQAQQSMMEARLARLAAAVPPAPLPSMPPATTSVSASSYAVAEQEEQQQQQPSPPPGEADAEAGLTAEQIQLFERGNQDLLQHYETTLDKVRAAEQSLVEIAELQTMLVSNLEVQSAHVDQMVEDAVRTAENVDRGNRELKKALARPSTARYTFYAASGLCLFVVVWDLFV